MKTTFTPFDKALIGFLLPLLGTAVQVYESGGSLKVAVTGFVISVLTGAGVFFKANE